jgi:glycosyltransferase involved in cell wall biosynthesis
MKRILFLGRISPIKNLEVVFKALPQINQKVVFEIVGPSERDYLEKLKSLIQNLNISSKVNFSKPIFNIKEKIKLLDSTDIFILPSKSEGMPQALIEAMARGKIVIASDNPASKDLIVNEENGFLFKNDDEKDLALQLNKILSLPNQKLIKIKSNAKKSVSQFSWERIIKKLESIF